MSVLFEFGELFFEKVCLFKSIVFVQLVKFNKYFDKSNFKVEFNFIMKLIRKFKY